MILHGGICYYDNCNPAKKEAIMGKDWKNSERIFSERNPCKHCLVSRSVTKIKEAVSRAARKMRNVWDEYRKNKNS